MIYVDRSAVPAPAIFSSDRVRKAQKAAGEHFLGTESSKRQRRFEFDSEIWRDPGVFDALSSLFRRKCAFCETTFTFSEPQIAHLRPRSNARDPYRDAVDADHYWWLAYRWENLYLACMECERNLGTQFPIRKARADSRSDGLALRAERPLLLDPCHDQPEKHLRFDARTGLVSPMGGPDPRTSRGAATIELLGLNREPLVMERLHTIARARQAMEAVLRFTREDQSPDGRTPDVVSNTLRSYLGMAAPHVAATRAMILEELRQGSVPAPLFALLLRTAGMDTGWLVRDSTYRVARIVEGAPPHAGVAYRNTYVTRVQISNFRAIQELDLSLPQGRADTAPSGSEGDKPWTVLLGENGAGKSSVVQAICLALAGADRAAPQLATPAGFLRLPQPGETPSSQGFVRVSLSTEPEPVGFTFTRERVTWEGSGVGSGTFLRAYGSTRLLPRPNARPRAQDPRVQIANLFDPFVPLHHAGRWLAKLPAARFDVAARALRDLLRLGEDDGLITRRRGEVWVPQPGGAVPLRQLSDGYQAVIALAVDIMAGTPVQEKDFSTTPGIVLLDELGTHLHPRWRMEIVGSLRRAFRSMQFIATTHEPLCLRGVRAGEVVLMRREGAGVRAFSDLPAPDSMTVEQLLTSPMFGLHTTIDPDLEREFQEYYDLLVEPELNAEHQQRKEQLRGKLTARRLLGHTRRDQLLYDVVDGYLAGARKAEKPVTELPDTVKAEIRGIWDRVRELGSGAR